MATTQQFRCYYDDGTVFVSADCPDYNNDSPLINSEFQMIQDVSAPAAYPWLLIILGLIYVFSEQKGKPK